MAAVRRCFGQINVHPGVWAPSWVPAALVLYDADTSSYDNGGGVGLSVLWRDGAQAVRHVIDATRLHARLAERCGAARVAWPTCAAGAAHAAAGCA